MSYASDPYPARPGANGTRPPSSGGDDPTFPTSLSMAGMTHSEVASWRWQRRLGPKRTPLACRSPLSKCVRNSHALGPGWFRQPALRPCCPVRCTSLEQTFHACRGFAPEPYRKLLQRVGRAVARRGGRRGEQGTAGSLNPQIDVLDRLIGEDLTLVWCETAGPSYRCSTRWTRESREATR